MAVVDATRRERLWSDGNPDRSPIEEQYAFAWLQRSLRQRGRVLGWRWTKTSDGARVGDHWRFEVTVGRGGEEEFWVFYVDDGYVVWGTTDAESRPPDYFIEVGLDAVGLRPDGRPQRTASTPFAADSARLRLMREFPAKDGWSVKVGPPQQDDVGWSFRYAAEQGSFVQTGEFAVGIDREWFVPSDADWRLSAMSRGRVAGMLLGGGIGDALGAPVEFMSWAEISSRPRGPVTGPEPAYGQPFAITDDTQMTLFTAESLVQVMRGVRPGLELAGWRSYQQWLQTQSVDEPLVSDRGILADQRLYATRAPGMTCLSALEQGRMGLVTAPINDSKGCGGVMRVAPVAAVSAQPARDAAALAALTHGHRTGFVAAGVFAALLAEVLDRPSPPAGAAPFDEAMVRSALAAAGANGDETASAVEAALSQSRTGDVGVSELSRLGAGWVAEEALAIAIWCCLVEPDPVRAVLLAVNHSGDSDSTGSMVGQLMGAAHGDEVWPEHWVEQLELADLLLAYADALTEPQRLNPHW